MHAYDATKTRLVHKHAEIHTPRKGCWRDIQTKQHVHDVIALTTLLNWLVFQSMHESPMLTVLPQVRVQKYCNSYSDSNSRNLKDLMVIAYRVRLNLN